MVNVLASSVVFREIEPGRVKQKTMQLVFVASPLSTKKAALMRKNNDWMARDQDNMPV
jgi:hypothetical protein